MRSFIMEETKLKENRLRLKKLKNKLEIAKQKILVIRGKY